ncbi:MAG: biotin carboxylase N-terminal domain-containing protein [Myxococcota bacterium]|nr:biotin carboxylase N-terminal domain-containing protein [Myxococcota bacterium]
MSFSKVLVANRGEIALRIMRTCRNLGFGTVAVFSEADLDAPHVEFADEAICLGPAAASESYLSIEKVIEAAKVSGADAIHPGYGFLAENAAFAGAVVDAGIVFIGPGVDAIQAMGDKARARTLMESRGVPVTPGYSGSDQADETLIEEAQRIGFPLLVKAAAGGGGKGMSIVRQAAELRDSLKTARRVAESAFGNSALLLERYIESPRHIEVQIIGDSTGQVIHCFERECSIQRRFQKVIEEAPSMAIDDALRQKFCDAAVTAGEALGYIGAGTVEFIMAPSGEFFFLEVNTRLQVEHPVTEMITGLDLVEWQLRVAAGESLPPQDTITRSGHAIEARIYAEDPENEFLPATGQLVAWDIPTHDGVRIDSGVRVGTTIGIDYDPMLAKVIAWAPHRASAVRKLARTLEQSAIAGVTTNRLFLADVLRDQHFERGDFSTHFLADHYSDWAIEPSQQTIVHGVVSAAVYFAEARAEQRAVLPNVRPGWRNNPIPPIVDHWQFRDQRFGVGYQRANGNDYRVSVDSDQFTVDAVRRIDDTISLRLKAADTELSQLVKFKVVPTTDGVFVIGDRHAMFLQEDPRFPKAETDFVVGGCTAPMPGRVIQLHVKVGDVVEAGQPLVVLEAMKMEQVLVAPSAGHVSEVGCAEGDIVEAGLVLVVVDEPTDETA